MIPMSFKIMPNWVNKNHIINFMQDTFLVPGNKKGIDDTFLVEAKKEDLMKLKPYA